MTRTQTLNSLALANAIPSDCPHLLIWDNPNSLEFGHLEFRYGAQRIDYRDNVVTRLKSGNKYLNLHRNCNLELAEIKTICQEAIKPVVLLEGLDILFAYLMAKSGKIELFWRNLADTRHLNCILWIVLPSSLLWHGWDKNRIMFL